ncbi:hypothetical protein EDD86DRAFT_199936 [Gorgonomyces haynaldii]|nr:hypothetical protein EDD86DRAFT_199936 [Gorgonomyces haynaldii]
MHSPQSISVWGRSRFGMKSWPRGKTELYLSSERDRYKWRRALRDLDCKTHTLCMITVAASTVGGLMLAASVAFFTSVYGRVLGVSGMIKRTFTSLLEGKLDTISAYFLAGMFVAGRFISSPDFSQSHPVSLAVLGGLLTGAGATLANGCTSGHGLCGLSRLSPRSIAAVGTLMLSGIVGNYLFFGPRFNQEPPTLDFSLPDVPTAVLIVPAMLFVGALLVPRQISTKFNAVSSFAVGITFGTGLLVSGMTTPSKIQDFLSLPSVFFKAPDGLHSSFDPSLMFVLGAGLLPNLFIYPLIRRVQEKPLSTDDWALPQNTLIDKRLILGSSLFGLGFGIGGICPGPFAVIASHSLSQAWVLSYGIAYLVGLSAVKHFDERTQRKLK